MSTLVMGAHRTGLTTVCNLQAVVTPLEYGVGFIENELAPT